MQTLNSLRRNLYCYAFFVSILALSGFFSEIRAQDNPVAIPSPDRDAAEAREIQTKPAPFWLTAGVMGLVDVIILGGMVIVAGKLKQSNGWSLADALSEEAGAPRPTNQPVPPVEGNPVSVLVVPAPVAPLAPAAPVMIASTSRLIAFLGLIAILGIYIGVGNYALWRLFYYGSPPDFKGVLAFLFGGASLFVPYAINQFRTAFEAFAGK